MKSNSEMFHALCTYGDKEGRAEYEEELRCEDIDYDLEWQEAKRRYIEKNER